LAKIKPIWAQAVLAKINAGATTRQEICEKVGISIHTLSKLLTGTRITGNETENRIIKICKLLEIER
jgi:transcriptional regulator with XRE-family HTH domain